METAHDKARKILMDGSKREVLQILVDNRDNFPDAAPYAIAVKCTQDIIDSLAKASESSDKLQKALILTGLGMWAYVLLEISKLIFI